MKNTYLRFIFLFAISFGAAFVFKKYIWNRQSVSAPSLANQFITIPDSICNITAYNDSVKLCGYFNHTVRPGVLVYFDASCSICFAHLEGWRQQIEKNNLNPHRFIFVGYNSSIQELKYVTEQALHNKYAVFRDSAFAIGKKNNLEFGGPKSFVLDEKGGILLKGDPFADSILLQNFLKKIKND